MLIEPKRTLIAYRCPKCADTIFGIAGKFALNADMLRLKCPCGESALEIKYTPDKKIRISVPCLFCGKSHSFVVSQSIFFERDIFMLNCPYTNMDICFIGEKEKIEEALGESEKRISEILSDIGLESIKNAQDDSGIRLPDSQIYDIVKFLITELEADGAIHCRCDGDGDYRVEIIDGNIRVRCEKCGAERTFSANSLEAAREFLNYDEIYLE